MTTRDQTELLLDQAEDALEQADPDLAIERCQQALDLDPDHPGAYFVMGDALRALGHYAQAAFHYEHASQARPDHAPTWGALALTRFDLLDLPGCERAINRALQCDPRNAEAWWVRSLLHEWNRDLDGAERAQRHAHWLAPQQIPLPPSIDDDELDTIINSTIAQLHPDIQAYLRDVPIIIQPMPSEDLLRETDPPASPLDLLGTFTGHSLVERSFDQPWSHLPPAILLFRGNIARMAHDRDELVDQLRVTFFHELGHFLGLDESDLEARGLQ